MSENNNFKPIQINPDLFNIKKTAQKNKSLKIRNIQPNKLKNDLLSRIKDYKKEKKELEKENLKEDNRENQINDINDNNDNNFDESINFLKNLSIKNNNLECKKENNDLIIDNSNLDKTENQSTPKFGCLKNGNLPTFREWKRTTIKNNKISTFDTTNNIVENNQNNNNIKQLSLEKKKQKCLTYKYSLGKKNGKVSILIKNNKTRKRIMDEHLRSKNVNIHDMKKYLKRHNLLKSGSYAPNEVIKKIYEDAILSGNIKNKNSENMLSNLQNN